MVEGDFPDETFNDINEVDGRDLYKILEETRSTGQDFYKRLSPSYMCLFHEVVKFHNEYMSSNRDKELICFVVKSNGTVEVEGRSCDIKSGDSFLLPSRMRVKIINSSMILYQFGYE